MAPVPSGRFDRARARRARQALGLTQAQVAEKIGVKETAVYSWESGKTRPRVTHLRDLAAVLGLQVGDLQISPGGRVLLKELRDAARLKQDELATRLNAELSLTGEKRVTQVRVSNWERAKTLVPEEYAAGYASVLGVTVPVLAKAVRDTWSAGGKSIGWRPPMDRREEEFKGVAAGHPELEFVYRMASHAFELVAVLARSRYINGVFWDDVDESDLAGLSWRVAHSWIKDVRERTVAIRDQTRGRDEDVAGRARSVLHTLDQYLTVVEDMMGLQREKLPNPFDEAEMQYRRAEAEHIGKLFPEVFGDEGLSDDAEGAPQE